MARDRPARHEDEDGDAEEGGLRPWARDVVTAVVIVVVFFGVLFAYARVWPPLVVVESESMQHSDSESFVGVIDTGDLVLVQSAPSRSSVVTWIQGRVTGHSTYGDYGDVIVFRRPGSPAADPVIHRAILYVVPNGTGAYDVPDLRDLPSSEWEGRGRGWEPRQSPYALRELTIRGMGFRRDLVITFNLTNLAAQPASFGQAGYVTMGDHNAYGSFGRGYDPNWVVPQGNLLGVARGELPWFGLLKLTFAPTGDCCSSWGDPRAPRNSWDSLLMAIVVLVALPLVIEVVGWAWSRRQGSDEPRARKALEDGTEEPPEAPAPEAPEGPT